jgi:hypothetical protein
MSERSLSRALRWPLWSWRNLALTVVALLVIGVAIGRLVGGSAGDAPGSVSARSSLDPPNGSTVATPPAAATPDVGTAPAGPAPAGQPSATPPAAGPSSPDEARGDAAARTMAARRADTFVQAWLRAGTAQQRAGWLRAVAGDRLVAQLAGLPPSALAVRPVGRPVVVSADQAEAVVTIAMSDGRTALLEMTAEADGWRVSSLSTTSTPPSGTAAPSSAAAG